MIGTLHSNNFNLHSPSNCSGFSRENTYDSSGDKRTKYFHATQPRSHADITVCHNHMDNRSICPDCVEIVFHSNRFLPGRLDGGSCVVILFSSRYYLLRADAQRHAIFTNWPWLLTRLVQQVMGHFRAKHRAESNQECSSGRFSGNVSYTANSLWARWKER